VADVVEAIGQHVDQEPADERRPSKAAAPARRFFEDAAGYAAAMRQSAAAM
jgi:hypothetical protein